MQILSEMNAAKQVLLEIANQTYGLAMGLQNAAPSQAQAGGPPRSVQYLLEISLQINKLSKNIQEIVTASSANSEAQKFADMVQMVRDILQHDTDLRTKYEVVEKFRFVRDRLQNLLTHLEAQDVVIKQEKVVQTVEAAAANSILVYVYLYNAQGVILRSWSTLFTPKVFYEYSVNRPIYRDKSAIEALLKSKSNLQQHGYLTIRVQESDLLVSANLKDALGNEMIKVREGSLHFKNLLTFTHNGQEYVVNEQGELVKKI